jgi:hypothetical protein
MVDNKNRALINLLDGLRQWERDNLPLCKTNKGYDIFLRLTNEVMSLEPRLKNIYAALPYSEVTIRVALKQLEAEGWLELPSAEGDLRIKNIVVTEKFNQIFCRWVTEIESIMSRSKGL